MIPKPDRTEVVGLPQGMCHYSAMLNHHFKTGLLGAAACLLMLSGCVGTTDQPTAAATDANRSASADNSPVPPAEPPAVERIDVPIPEGSLLPLLEAEFALRAGRFGQALAIMTEQAEILTDPELARRALRLAEFLRDDDRALITARRLAELDPRDGAAAATVMSRLTRRGQVSEALEYAQRAKTLGTRINAPLLVTDLEQLDASQRQAVSEGIEALAAQWPEDTDIAIARALLYRELLNPGAAAELVAVLLERAPDEERALVLWTQLQIDLEDASPFGLIAAAVDRNPDNERLRLQYARLLASNERFIEARQQFDDLIARSPRNDEYLMASALIDLELQRYDGAVASLQTLLDLGQRVEEANYYLGRTQEAAGDIDAAVAAYGAVDASREFIDAKRRAAALLLEHRDGAALAQFFVAQRSRFPKESQRLYLVHASALSESTPPEALAVYDDALAQHPDAISLRYGRAMLYEADGDIEGMERDLRIILDNDPDNATTLNALGYSLTNHTDRYEEAAALIERALSLAPREPAMLDSLGWVYFKLGRLQEAESLLREAYGLLPDPEVAAHLGEALWALGKRMEAKDIWRDGLARDANSAHVLNTLDRLGIDLDS